MIAGVVSAYLEALVHLTLRGPGGQEEDGYELTLQAVEGGRVIIHALP